jgi:hypothetical protein
VRGSCTACAVYDAAFDRHHRAQISSVCDQSAEQRDETLISSGEMATILEDLRPGFSV